MKLSKEQTLENLKKVLAKIKEIKANKGKATYKSNNLFLEQFGCIQDMTETNQLLFIHTWLGEYGEKVERAAKAIGIWSDGFEVTIQDLTIEEWLADVVTRVNQLNEKVILKKLGKAQEIFEKHLNEDQAFAIDMDKAGDVLKGVKL